MSQLFLLPAVVDEADAPAEEQVKTDEVTWEKLLEAAEAEAPAEEEAEEEDEETEKDDEETSAQFLARYVTEEDASTLDLSEFEPEKEAGPCGCGW